VLDASYVLAIAAVMSGLTIILFATRVVRADPAQPEHLIGQLRLAQWAAVLLGGAGAISIGLAIASPLEPLAGAEAALGVVIVAWSGLVLQRDPREALVFVAAGFVAHALFNLAHRPGWFASAMTPHWYIVGITIYDVCLAAVCFWARRR
jgi:hypothetical protein